MQLKKQNRKKINNYLLQLENKISIEKIYYAIDKVVFDLKNKPYQLELKIKEYKMLGGKKEL